MSRDQDSDSAQNDIVSGEIEWRAPHIGTPAAFALQANAAIKVSRVEKGLRKIRGIKRPKLKNFKLNRMYKTLRDAAKKRSRNFKGKVIDGLHELYTLTAGMMLGMRCSIGNMSAAGRNALVLSDFSYVEKVDFPPEGNNKPPFRTPPHSLSHTFKFKTYAPRVFSRIREFFNVDRTSYMLSVCGDYDFIEFLSNSKSGQFFFYSHDGRYMIKTQTTEENRFMNRILPHYYKYITENPHTLLVKIFGMHRVKMYHLRRKIHFVIMGSVFDSPEEIHKIYDLKGSLVGREATPKERDEGGVLKDKDLIIDGRKFHLGPKKEAFMAQIAKDARFLAKLNIMDYSLLIGIHDRNKRGEISADAAPPQSTALEKAPTIHPPQGEGNLRSKTPFRRGSVRFPNPDEEKGGAEGGVGGAEGGMGGAEVVMAKDVNNLVDDILEYGICKSSESEKYGDITGAAEGIACQEAPCCFPAADEDIPDINDIHCDDGDSDLDEDWDEHLDHFVIDDSDEDEVAPLVDSLKLKGIGKVKSVIQDSKTDFAIKVDTEVAGKGALGVEGGDLARFFRSSESLASIRHDDLNIDGAGEKTTRTGDNLSTAGSVGSDERFDPLSWLHLTNPKEKLVVRTYGPGKTRNHPWTSREDGGINSRSPDGKIREPDIYFAGIIDILQQYNHVKRVENFFKGFSHDRHQISAVPAEEYAERFIKFLESNII